MPLICGVCGKVKSEVYCSIIDEKPISRCPACHYAALMAAEKARTPEQEKELKQKRVASLKKAREAAAAKRQAKKDVQSGKRETV